VKSPKNGSRNAFTAPPYIGSDGQSFTVRCASPPNDNIVKKLRISTGFRSGRDVTLSYSMYLYFFRWRIRSARRQGRRNMRNNKLSSAIQLLPVLLVVTCFTKHVDANPLGITTQALSTLTSSGFFLNLQPPSAPNAFVPSTDGSPENPVQYLLGQQGYFVVNLIGTTSGFTFVNSSSGNNGGGNSGVGGGNSGGSGSSNGIGIGNGSGNGSVFGPSPTGGLSASSGGGSGPFLTPNVVATPEPRSLFLVGIGLLVLILARGAR
jgi:hypothetical protein